VRESSPIVRRDEEGLPATHEPAPQAIAERLLALATLAPQSERVVRRAWRSAQRLDAPLDILVVRPPGRAPSAEDRARLESLRRLVSMLGARLHVEEGEDVAAVAIRVARAQRSTYLLMGPPSGRRRLGRLGEPLLMRLVRGLPGVDIRVVSDPTQREGAGDLDEALLDATGAD